MPHSSPVVPYVLLYCIGIRVNWKYKHDKHDCKSKLKYLVPRLKELIMKSHF